MKHYWSSVLAQSERASFPDLAPAVAAGSVRLQHSLSAKEAVGDNRQKRADKTESIRSTALSFSNMHEFGDLLTKYLKTRKAVFIERLGWHVSEADNMEFDQYDTPFCRWVILHEFGEVLGGVRLMPTTARCGIYSYMLRDAQLGVLEDLPTDVLFFKAPVHPTVWEASRFFITDAVPAARRTAVQRLLFGKMNETAAGHGARFLLGIVPSVWARWARRLDATAVPIGARFSIDGTSSQSVLFNIHDAPALATEPNAAP